MKQKHIPVLLKEVLFYLQPQANKNYVDATLGFGGHTKAILNLNGPKGIVIGVDRDEEALMATSRLLVDYKERFKAFHGNFTDVDEATKNISIDGGIIADLGVSSFQLDTADRGFSFKDNAPLDMRMNRKETLTAEIIVNEFSEDDLKKILYEYGEENFSPRISEGIVEARKSKKITTTGELVEIVKKLIPRKFWPQKIHPATRTFQAIRIAVNNELGSLKEFLPKAINLLEPGARLAIISFHSLEDRMVKKIFVEKSIKCVCPPQFPKCICDKKPEIKIITKKPIMASESEIAKNPRSRSAKLRVIEKL